MNDFTTELRKIPPVTRTLCGSCLAVTLSVLSGMVSGYKILYTFGLAFKKLEIWRIYTNFFLGSLNINYIFDFAMLYRSIEQLESGPYARRSADLAYQLFMAGVAIIITSIPVQSTCHFRPLLLCIAYLGSALAPLGAQTSIMGLFTLPMKYLPYIMLGMDLLMGGPGAVAISLPGAVVGHLWWWGVWGSAIGGAGGVLTPYATAPQWLRDYMGEGNAPPPRRAGEPTGANAGGGVHVIPPRRYATTSAPTPPAATGYQWGSGNQLGAR